MSTVLNDFETSNEGKEITRQSKSNFLYSFSLLPKEKNDAINVIYAFCRKTDDIADDESGTPEEKFGRLTEWRTELERALSGGDSKHELLNSLGKVINKFNIPFEPFFDLIGGMEMDITKNRYNNFEELIDYCYKVASSVGLMCIEIFGYNNSRTKNFAINLGIALQLTNIIRDIKPDAERGRIYIPMEDLRRFNYSEKDLLENRYDTNFMNLMEYECERARFFYNEANKHLADEDKGLMFSARIMEHIYFRVLEKIEKKDYNVFDRKVRVSRLKKIYITAGVYLKYRMLYGFNENKLAMNGK